MNEDPINGAYRFGPFELNVSAHVLRRGGARVHLQPKAFETLLLLVSQAGQVVDKEALLERVWRGQVVSDNALTRAIREVRRALGDSATEPEFIETVPRVGYRFRAPVERVEAGAAPEGAAPGRAPGPSAGPARWVALVAILAGVAVAAWWLGTQRATPRPEATVLAFEHFGNATGDPDVAYLGDGMVEGVARRLGVAEGMRVVQLPGGERAADAARRFDADWRLSGTMQNLRGETVVVAELAPVDGELAWRREFPLVQGDVVAAGQALADAVAQTIGVDLPQEPAYLSLTADTDRIRAHRLYLTGRGHLARRRPAEVVRAVELFEQALELMPGHAGAMASLGVAYVLGPDDRFPPATARQRAAALFERALEVDPSTALAYAGQGLLLVDGDAAGQSEAKALLEKALALDPNDPDALVWYASVLGSEGRIREAAEAQRQALALEPDNPSVTGNLAFNLARLGLHEEALALLEPVAEDGLTEPMLYYQRFAVLGYRGQFAEVFGLAAEAALRMPNSPFFLGSLGGVAWQLGMRDFAAELAGLIDARWPANPWVLGGLSDLPRASGDPAGMERWLARVAALPGVDLARPSTFPEPLVVPVALVQLDLGRNRAAIEALEQRHPDPEALVGSRGDLAVPANEVQWLALALRREGNGERADAWLDAVQQAIGQRAAAGVRDFTPLMLVEARNLAMQGQGEEALTRLGEMLDLGWHDVDALVEDPRWGAVADTPGFGRLVERAREMTAEDREAVLARYRPEDLLDALRAALGVPPAGPGDGTQGEGG